MLWVLFCAQGLPKYVLPVGGQGGKGGRRYSHYAPLVTKSSDNVGQSSSAAAAVGGGADQDEDNSSEEEGGLASRLFSRTGSTRSKAGASSVGKGSVSSAAGVVSGASNVVRHRITRGGSEVSEDDSVMSAPATTATAQ